MPRKAKSPCRYPGCREICDGQYCEKHKAEVNAHYNRFIRDPQTSRRYDSRWRKIRAAYIRKNPLCEMCKAGAD